ncbi:MAG: hypothetical protein ACI4FZ_07605 [Lachnospiraceae bacterium]
MTDYADAIEQFFNQLIAIMNTVKEYIADDGLQGALITIFNAVPLEIRTIFFFMLLLTFFVILINRKN